MRFFNDGTWGKFDLSGIEELKEDYGIAVETGNKLFMIGYTRNEVNQRLQLGMPKDDVDGDIRYLPINLVPVGEDEGGVPKKSINLDDKTLNTDKFVETTKNKYQNRYLHIQGAMEKKLESKLKRYFFNLRKKILGIVNGEEKAFTAEEEAEIMAQINALFSGDEIKVVVEPIYRESLKQAGELALENIGIANRTFIISEAILNQRLNLIKGVDNTLFKLIRSEVFDGIKEGENIPNISERIRSVFNTTSNRSKVIARTETASLMSAQTQDVYVKEGIQQKQWLATIDDATRDSHIQTNGEIVPIDQPFSNGLMFPGDPDAPAEEVINCRCSLVPIVQ
jgi:SPP1 gp7 family putative phage head morphogenesis protein